MLLQGVIVDCDSEGGLPCHDRVARIYGQSLSRVFTGPSKRGRRTSQHRIKSSGHRLRTGNVYRRWRTERRVFNEATGSAWSTSWSWLLDCIKNVFGSYSRINTWNIKRWFLAFLKDDRKRFSASTFYNDFFSSCDIEYFRKPLSCFRICIYLHNFYSKTKMPISRAILCMPKSRVINGHFKLPAHSKKYASYA